jgi:hypothetical protein
MTSSRRKKDHIFPEQEGRAYKCVSPDISFHVRVALAPLTPKSVHVTTLSLANGSSRYGMKGHIRRRDRH